MDQQRFFIFTLSMCCFVLWGLSHAVSVQADVPVVRAVLFFSPRCPHSHKVIEEDLKPLLAHYGGQLQIVGVNVMDPVGQSIYQKSVERFKIPDHQLGIPTLIVERVVLVGSLDIPQRFPGLVESYLAQGRVDWPDISGLTNMLPTGPPPTPTLVRATPSSIAAEPSLPARAA